MLPEKLHEIRPPALAALPLTPATVRGGILRQLMGYCICFMDNHHRMALMGLGQQAPSGKAGGKTLPDHTHLRNQQQTTNQSTVRWFISTLSSLPREAETPHDHRRCRQDTTTNTDTCKHVPSAKPYTEVRLEDTGGLRL